MPKLITSPVDHWPGTVTLSDPLTFPQVIALEDAYADIQTARQKAQDSATTLTQARVDQILLGAVCQCVESWQLAGLSEQISADRFPSTPRVASARLVAWLIGELTAIYRGEENDVPNE